MVPLTGTPSAIGIDCPGVTVNTCGAVNLRSPKVPWRLMTVTSWAAMPASASASSRKSTTLLLTENAIPQLSSALEISVAFVYVAAPIGAAALRHAPQ